MNEYQQKAEQYVREQIPELMELSFGCHIRRRSDGAIGIFCGITAQGYVNVYTQKQKFLGWGVFIGDVEIIGHRPQPQHWLRVLGVQSDTYSVRDNVFSIAAGGKTYNAVNFNLTTGQPATEEDYKAVCEIVNI